MGMNLFASDFMGGALSYTQSPTNPCVYTIRFQGYYDCSGATPANPIVNINGGGTACNSNLTLSLASPVIEVTPVCPGTLTQCLSASSTITGVNEYIFEGTFTACGLPCTRFALSYSNCCRSGTILNLSNPSTYNTFLRTDTIDVGISNSSPKPLNNPVMYVCSGQNTSYSLAHSDADGDSLVYFLSACKSTNSSNIPYNLGYSASSPLGSGWNVSLNATSGHLSLVAQTGAALGSYSVCYQVNEYRNNVKIGSSTRDMQIYVVNCASSVVNCCHADFNYTVTGSSVSFSNLSSSTSSSFNWNFGDGTSSTVFSPLHTYLNAGTYIVSLAIASASGCTDTAYYNVTVYGAQASAPTPVFSYMIMGNGQVQFNGSATGGSGVVLFSWNYGNGATGTGANASYQYTTSGSYNVCLTVTDALGQSNTTCQAIFINIPPPLSVTVTGTPIGNGSVQLAGTATGGISPYTYSWSCVGGALNNAFSATPVVTYSTSGTYNACLYVTDANGTIGSSCQTLNVTVPPPPSNCYAGFSFATTGITQPVVVNFTADSVNSSFVYNWDFGDGSNGTGSAPVHTYTQNAVYTVCLIVTQPGTTCADTVCQSISIGIGIDLNGYIFAGSAVDTFEVYLIQHDTTGGGTLTAIDTQTVWGAPAYYSFTNQDPSHIYFTKAAMKAGTINYANYMPTYYDTALMWANAHPIIPMSMPPAPANFDIYMQIGTNPGGAGFIGGLISQGANKTTTSSIENVEVMLWDMANEPVAYTYTDASGQFTFSNLAYGTYKIYPEILNKTTFPKIVTISGTMPSINNIEMLIQYDSIYDITSTLSTTSPLFASLSKAYPNPTNDKLSVEMELKEAATLQFSILDVNGKVVFERSEKVSAGKQIQVLNMSALTSGMYFLKISEGDSPAYMQKVVKW